jgi:hypothetical protein
MQANLTSAQNQDTNILFIYDVPKKLFTSVKLAEVIKQLTAYDLASSRHAP